MTKLTFILALFLVFANADDENDSQNREERNNFVKHTFGRLLKSVVKMNQQRFDAMKNLNRLNDYNAAVEALRTGREVSDRPSVLAFVFLNNHKSEATRQLAERMDSSESESNSAEDKPKSPDATKLRAFKGCRKKAAKVCKKACIDAYKATCAEFHCSKKMKKEFKKQCKSTCKNRFN